MYAVPALKFEAKTRVTQASSGPPAFAISFVTSLQFVPALLPIQVGTKVEFPNLDDTYHNVFSYSPAKRFDLGLYRPGESKSVVFDKPGAVFLYCSIHRYMDGVIYVAPTPYFSKVESNGSYKIENVPAGFWTVKTWQRRKRFPEHSNLVQVKAGDVTKDDIALTKKQ